MVLMHTTKQYMRPSINTYKYCNILHNQNSIVLMSTKQYILLITNITNRKSIVFMITDYTTYTTQPLLLQTLHENQQTPLFCHHSRAFPAWLDFSMASIKTSKAFPAKALGSRCAGSDSSFIGEFPMVF